MRIHIFLMGVLLPSLLLSAPRVASGQDSIPSISQRLAAEIARGAMDTINSDPLTVEAIQASIILLEEAVTLDPQNPELWHDMLNLGFLAEREDIKSRAVSQLLLLEPENDALRLIRLNMAIDRYNTVQERIAAYEKFLQPDSRAQIGPPAASRLALDLALLHQRRGDSAQFSHWLTEALVIDPSNRSAAGLAAGFFRMNLDDPHAEAELLINLILADPPEPTPQVALGQLLLEYGAYAGAKRFYERAVRCTTASGGAPSAELLADLAIAQWATGDSESALETIDARQQAVDDLMRAQAAQDNPELTSLELSKITGPIQTTLATVRAAISEERSAADAAATLDAAIQAYDATIKIAEAPPGEGQQANPIIAARLHLEAAMVTLWLGGSVDVAEKHIAAAEAVEPISDAARQRFDGWKALRTSDLEKAAELFAPLTAEDNAAAIGMALVELERGNKREAATLLLKAANGQPGALVGVWSANKLASLLGKRLPLSDVATRLEALIQSIPQVFDRLPGQASLALRFRVIPRKTSFNLLEPVIIELEITNTSQYPLAIDREGPIRPQVVLLPSLSVANVPAIDDLPPIVIDIGRRLSLQPREHLAVPIDLRRTPIGKVLNAYPLPGAVIDLSAINNVMATFQGALQPSMLGSRVDAPIIRVEGMPFDDAWLERMTAKLADPNNTPDPVDAYLLNSLVMVELPRNVPAADRQRHEAGRNAVLVAFSKLDGISQAWLLALTPRDLAPDPLLTMVRKSEDRWVKFAYLTFHLTGADDPMLDAAQRGEDPGVRRLAELIAETARVREQILESDGKPSTGTTDPQKPQSPPPQDAPPASPEPVPPASGKPPSSPRP